MLVLFLNLSFSLDMPFYSSFIADWLLIFIFASPCFLVLIFNFLWIPREVEYFYGYETYASSTSL